ncbi:MAG TPA: hypothetical protein VFW48_12105, partial [Solirubrobacterales bacterium]|nr:hypothetical protein [Solirubrobacterales bacterium]
MPRARALGAAVGGRASDAGGAIQERVAWPVSDFLRGLFDVARWPFERIVWTFERAVVWPLGERTAGRGVPGRAVVLSGVALLAVGALSLAAIRAGNGSGEEPAVVVAPVKAPVERPEPEPAPVLQGAVPDFVPEDGGTAAAKVAKADTVISSDAGT